VIAKLRSKPLIAGIIFVVVVALVAVFAVPAIAAGSNPGTPNKNVTVVKGVIASLTKDLMVITTAGSTPGTVSLAIDSSTNFNIHGNSWLTSFVGESVTAVYNNNQKAQPPVASQVTINMPAPTPPNGNSARVQGTLTVSTNGTISIQPATGAAVGPLSLDKNTSVSLHGVSSLSLSGSNIMASFTVSGNVSVVYNSKTNVVNQININLPAPPAKSTPPVNSPAKGKMGMVQGSLNIKSPTTITITPKGKTALGPLTIDLNTGVTLRGATLAGTLPLITASVSSNGTASAVYNTQDKIVNQLAINMPAAPLKNPQPVKANGQLGGPANPPASYQAAPGQNKNGKK
jgi:hypothetical protein